MARVGGINIPDNKHIDVALTHIYGIGRKTAQDICNKLDIKFSTKKYSYITEHIIDNKFIFPTIGYFHIICKYFNDKKRIILNNIEIKNMYTQTASHDHHTPTGWKRWAYSTNH